MTQIPQSTMFSKGAKSTYFSLLIYDLANNINKQCNDRFKDVFEEKIQYTDILDENIVSNLDYTFEEAYWMIEVGVNLGLDITKAKSAIEDMYNKYTDINYGFRYLITNEYYDFRNNRKFSEDEVLLNNERNNKLVKDLLDKINKK